MTNAPLFQLPGNYLKYSSVFSFFQLSCDYASNASAYQLSGNYLTNASAFQLSGNYITLGSLTAYAQITSPSFAGAPKINTYDIALKPWACFKYTGGTVNNYGVATITSIVANSGLYRAVFTPDHPSGTHYGLLITYRNIGGAGNYVVSSITSTSFRVATCALSSGARAARDFAMMTVQQILFF